MGMGAASTPKVYDLRKIGDPVYFRIENGGHVYAAKIAAIKGAQTPKYAEYALTGFGEHWFERKALFDGITECQLSSYTVDWD